MTRATLFASALAATAAIVAVPGSAQTQRITAKYNAPLKATPNPQGRILATVPKGANLKLDYCDANSWCHVEYKNRTGWMATVNLNLPAQHGQGTITTNAALRSGPGTQYKVTGMLYAGTRVNVAGCQSNYCQVSEEAKRGWVARALIDQGGNWTGPVPPLPGPGRNSELVMYTDRNCRGNTYSTIEAVPNVNYPVQSFQVRRGTGTGDASRDSWQICAGTNYNGVCTSTANSCSNLDGFNGRVRSVRPYWQGMGGGPGGGGMACTKEYAPVCARSVRTDRTFGNACEAKAAGYNVMYQGKCR